jgi:cytochrome c oxidase subunit 2
MSLLRSNRVLAAVCFVVLSLVFAGVYPIAGQAATDDTSPASSSAETREIQVTAKKYEFTPDTISVKRGEHVKLIVTALDHTHGFKLDAFGINQKLAKGEPTTIEFTADKPGTFKFECSHFCGMGHGRMKGKLVVEDAAGH